jgi:hypothetical protein
MKRIILIIAVVLGSIAVCVTPSQGDSQECEKRACKSGDTYDERQQRCESENGWGYESHYQPTCPAGYELDRTRGICVKQGECCEKPACKSGYRWDKSDERCESGPTFLGYRSHYTPKCEAGWDLDVETGRCKKRGCGMSTPGIVVQGAQAGEKPDLIVRAFGLLRWGSCRPGSVVFTFQVTVANVGAAASPRVVVQALDQHGNNWGNGAFVGALAPGRSQTVTISVYYLRASPRHMTRSAPHPFTAVVDPRRQVNESNEGNNTSEAINVGAPGGCS